MTNEYYSKADILWHGKNNWPIDWDISDFLKYAETYKRGMITVKFMHNMHLDCSRHYKDIAQTIEQTIDNSIVTVDEYEFGDGIRRVTVLLQHESDVVALKLIAAGDDVQDFRVQRG